MHTRHSPVPPQCEACGDHQQTPSVTAWPADKTALTGGPRPADRLSAILLVLPALASASMSALRLRGGNILQKDDALKVLSVAGIVYGGSCIFTPGDMLTKNDMPVDAKSVGLQQALGCGIIGHVVSGIVSLKGGDAKTASHAGLAAAMAGWIANNVYRVFGPKKAETKTLGAKTDLAICLVLGTILAASIKLK